MRPGEIFSAPHVIDLEVAQALRQLARRGNIDAPRADEALSDFGDLRIRRYPQGALLPRVWELRSNLSAFDAAYVALAEALGAPLITADAALSRAPGHSARIELFV